ncbi:MAG: hypothetical protein JW727_04050 [Candidatus Aenigmarchaeota archaeon]|nr:hypothetical protein [Candidatus Aenigmarchaeota archaeon]
MFQENGPRVMFITGYHENEAELGQEIVSSYQRQFGSKNTFFYEPEDNKGSIGGQICGKVCRQIYSKVHSLRPDLFLDIHHGGKVYPSTDLVLCELDADYGVMTPEDYAWYFNFAMQGPNLMTEPVRSNPYNCCNLVSTGLLAEFYLHPGDREFFGPKVYRRRIDEAATFLNRVTESYRDFRKSYTENPEFREKIDFDVRRLAGDHNRSSGSHLVGFLPEH